MSKKLFRLRPSDCIFLECDIQDKFTKHVAQAAAVVHNARRLASTAKIFNIPIVSTQQLPKLFGVTAKDIADVYDSYPEGTRRFDKIEFSMLEKPVWDHI
jgi:nicotinamidase-related amidase